ncbi:MAG: hypothetical protein ABSH33_11750 [Steroidobacteraceae bacterium]
MAIFFVPASVRRCRAGSLVVVPVRATSARVGERGAMLLDSKRGASGSSRK